MQAVQTGEMGALEHLLAEDVTLWADAGGKIKQAALRRISGRDAVARFSMGTRRFLPQDFQVELAEVNGQPATIFRKDGKAFLVLAIEIDAGRIQTVRLMANPEKLSHI